MIKLVYLLLVFLSICTIHNRVYSLSSEEIDGLYTLVKFFQLESEYPTNNTYCTPNTHIKCNNDRVIEITLVGNGTTTFTNLFIVSFPMLIGLSISNVSAPPLFLESLSTGLLNSLTCNWCGLTYFINFGFLQKLNLNNNPIEGEFDLAISQQIVIIEIYPTDLSLYRNVSYYISDKCSNLVTIEIMASSFINITFDLIPTLSKFKLSIGPNFNSSSLVNTLTREIDSIVGIVNIYDNNTIKQKLDFPYINNWNRISSINFENIDFNPVNYQIDLGRSNFTSFTIYNSPRISNSIYPTIYPLMIELISISGCQVTVYPISIPSIQFLILSNNNLTTLPDYSIYPSLAILDLSNNSIKGSLKNNSCLYQGYYTNNLLSGILPQCFMCHLGDPTVRGWISGNNFTNYKDNSSILPCNSLTIKSPIKLAPGEDHIVINGTNLGWGFQLNQIITSPLSSNNGRYKFSPNNQQFTILLSLQSSYLLSEIGHINITFLDNQNQTFKVDIITIPLYVDFIMKSLYYGQGYMFTMRAYGIIPTKLSTIKMGKYPCGIISVDQLFISCIVYDFNIPEGVYKFNITQNSVNSYYDYKFIREIPAFTSMTSPPREGGEFYIFGYFDDTIKNNTKIFYFKDLQPWVQGELPILEMNKTTIRSVIGPRNNSVGSLDLRMEIFGTNYTISFNLVYQGDGLVCPGSPPCSDKGICDERFGACSCYRGWNGVDCSQVGDTSTVVNGNGGTELESGNIKFGFKLKSIREVNIVGDLEREIVFGSKWNITKINSLKYLYNFEYQSLSNISYVVEEFKQDTNITFADIPMVIAEGSIKITVNIMNWVFLGSLNTLTLVMESYVKSDSECSTNINSANGGTDSLQYLMIERDGKTLYGRFIDTILSDSRPTYSRTYIIDSNQDSLLIGINLPHCTNCTIDPNFSVLVSEERDCSTKSNNWLIPTVTVVVVIVGLSVFITVAIVIKRHFIIGFKGGFFCMYKGSGETTTEMSDLK